jgi:membrane protein insertase Oxa1/YidC/SpoIIIJ
LASEDTDYMRNVTAVYLTKVSADRLFYAMTLHNKLKMNNFPYFKAIAANLDLDLSFHFALFIFVIFFLCNIIIIIITIIVTIRVQIFGNNVNKSKFYSGRNSEQIEVRECLLLFGAESDVFQFAIQKFRRSRYI